MFVNQLSFLLNSKFVLIFVMETFREIEGWNQQFRWTFSANFKVFEILPEILQINTSVLSRKYCFKILSSKTFEKKLEVKPWS